jgi:hypothetical protein
LASRMEERVARKVGSVTSLVHRAWVAEAMMDAKTGGYAHSIQAEWPVGDDPMRGRVFSDAPYAAALEYGTGARDMKPALLRSPKAKVSAAGGRYLAVPFRHGTPGAVTMPAMPHEVYARARRLGSGERLPDIRTGWRTKLPGSSGYRWAPGAPRVTEPYTWRTGPYSGMQRRGRLGHSQYVTFRTVSSNSPAGSWIYPGFAPRRFRERVMARVQIPPGL